MITNHLHNRRRYYADLDPLEVSPDVVVNPGDHSVLPYNTNALASANAGPSTVHGVGLNHNAILYNIGTTGARFGPNVFATNPIYSVGRNAGARFDADLNDHGGLNLAPQFNANVPGAGFGLDHRATLDAVSRFNAQSGIYIPDPRMNQAPGLYPTSTLHPAMYPVYATNQGFGGFNDNLNTAGWSGLHLMFDPNRPNANVDAYPNANIDAYTNANANANTNANAYTNLNAHNTTNINDDSHININANARADPNLDANNLTTALSSNLNPGFFDAEDYTVDPGTNFA